MERCIDCIHYDVCKIWAVDAFGDASLFPYEAEDNLCEHYKPVVHGEWKDMYAYYVCSKCEAKYLDKTKYCPDCGALMDGGSKK